MSAERTWTLAEQRPIVEADLVQLRAGGGGAAALALQLDTLTTTVGTKADSSALTSGLALKAAQTALDALTGTVSLKANSVGPVFTVSCSLPTNTTLNGVTLTNGGGGGGGGEVVPTIAVTSVAFPSGDNQLRFNFAGGMPSSNYVWQLTISDDWMLTPINTRFITVAKTATYLTVKGVPAYQFANGTTEAPCFFLLQAWQDSAPFSPLVRFAGNAWRSEGGSAFLEPYAGGGY